MGLRYETICDVVEFSFDFEGYKTNGNKAHVGGSAKVKPEMAFTKE